MQQEMLRTDFCDIFITLKNEDKRHTSNGLERSADSMCSFSEHMESTFLKRLPQQKSSTNSMNGPMIMAKPTNLRYITRLRPSSTPYGFTTSKQENILISTQDQVTQLQLPYINISKTHTLNPQSYAQKCDTKVLF